jgi:O-acetyl-ADP-ribose deacetylase (regulator of RNase III)
MLKYIEGDLFSSPAQVLVNTVNTVGVMGKGIALEFKKRYPEMFAKYKEQCDKHKLVIGKLMLWYAPDHWLLQFPTKEHWRNPSKIEYIEKGLMTFTRKYADYNISSIAFPKLGCGNGELSWNEVKPLMEKYLSTLPIQVYIYLGKCDSEKPEHKKQNEMEDFLKENAGDLSFEGIKDIICYHSMIAPITVEVDGVNWNVSWRKDGKLTYESGSEKAECDEDDVYQMWDEICGRQVFAKTNDLNNNIFCSLLETMGYLHSVKIWEEYEGKMQEGYQLELGKGRNYLIQGE